MTRARPTNHSTCASDYREYFPCNSKKPSGASAFTVYRIERTSLAVICAHRPTFDRLERGTRAYRGVPDAPASRGPDQGTSLFQPSELQK